MHIVIGSANFRSLRGRPRCSRRSSRRQFPSLPWIQFQCVKSKPDNSLLGGRRDWATAARERPPVAPDVPTPFWAFGKIQIHRPDRANRPYARPALAAPPVPGLIQPKLAVGRADDPFEHEADRIADRVLRMRRPDVETADDDSAVATGENYRPAWPALSLPAVASGSEGVWRQEDASEQDDETVEDVDGLLVQRAEHPEAGNGGLRAVPRRRRFGWMLRGAGASR
jgi:hypothetical protein